MNTVLAVPRLRSPGTYWLPQVLRLRATWLTVWRFVWAGPLIGGLPYAWMVIGLPFAYYLGAVPAAVAGLLFACWYHGQAGRVPTWPWRLAVGALAGVGATACIAFVQLVGRGSIDWFFVGIVAVHGVPAALVLASLQKPARPAA